MLGRPLFSRRHKRSCLPKDKAILHCCENPAWEPEKTTLLSRVRAEFVLGGPPRTIGTDKLTCRVTPETPEPASMRMFCITNSRTSEERPQKASEVLFRTHTSPHEGRISRLHRDREHDSAVPDQDVVVPVHPEKPARENPPQAEPSKAGPRATSHDVSPHAVPRADRSRCQHSLVVGEGGEMRGMGEGRVVARRVVEYLKPIALRDLRTSGLFLLLVR